MAALTSSEAAGAIVPPGLAPASNFLLNCLEASHQGLICFLPVQLGLLLQHRLLRMIFNPTFTWVATLCPSF